MLAALLCSVLVAFAPPALTGRVVDAAGVLTPDERARLEAELAAHEQQSGHQIAVVVVDSLDGATLEEASLQTAERWRLGAAGRDDGLLLFVAKNDRRVRVEVGYGLEGVVTDVVASRILREQVVPRFASGDYAGGIRDGALALARASDGEVVADADKGAGGAQAGKEQRGADPWGGLGVVALALLFLSAVLARVPRPARALLLCGVGAAVAFGVTGSFLVVGVAAFFGLVLGFAPVGVGLPFGGFGRGRFGGGGGGGFSGGGGRFGGGGASGKW